MLLSTQNSYTLPPWCSLLLFFPNHQFVGNFQYLFFSDWTVTSKIPEILCLFTVVSPSRPVPGILHVLNICELLMNACMNEQICEFMHNLTSAINCVELKSPDISQDPIYKNKDIDVR